MKGDKDVGSVQLDRRRGVLWFQIGNQHYDPFTDQIKFAFGRAPLVFFNKLFVCKGEGFLANPSFFHALFLGSEIDKLK